MGRKQQTEPPVPPEFVKQCFAIRQDGQLIWRERPAEHFPHRRADHACFNSQRAGERAGREGPSGRPLVRFQYEGRTRRLALLKAAFIAQTGEYPCGPVKTKNANGQDCRLANLTVAPYGAHKPQANAGRSSSLERRQATNAALLSALAERANPTLSELSAVVGLSEGRVSTRLGKLADAGFCVSPMCVPGRAWALTDAGRKLATSANPMVIDDLDRAVLRVIARSPSRLVAVAQQVEVCHFTARRRLDRLAEHGMAKADEHRRYIATTAGIAALPDIPPRWLDPQRISAAAARDVVERQGRERIDDRTNAMKSQHASRARLKAVAAARMNRVPVFHHFDLTG